MPHRQREQSRLLGERRVCQRLCHRSATAEDVQNSGERRDKKDRTLRALADAAVSLFTERGYDAVTMADIATAAGVSRRTAFRYFGAKDELTMEHPRAWLRVFDTAIATNQDLPVGERSRLASHAVGAYIEADPAPVRQLFALAFAHPALSARYAASSQEWIERMTAEIEPEMTPGPHSAAEALMLAAAIMGIINGACRLWAVGDERIGPLLDAGFDLVGEPLSRINRPPP